MNDTTALTAFTHEMAKKLEANSHKHGWDYTMDQWLLDRLNEEVEELTKALNSEPPVPDDIVREAADVANFAMFIAAKRLKYMR